MEIPLNIIHDYIGFPILLVLGFETLVRHRKNKTTTSLYIGIASLLAGTALFFFGVPAIFSHDSRIVSLGTLVGDFSLALAMMFVWFICTRAFMGTKKTLMTVANVAVILLTLLIMLSSLHSNLFPPYTSRVIIDHPNGKSVIYNESLLFNILNAIDSISFVLIAIFFWRQGDTVINAGPRIRIRSFAVCFVLAASPYLVIPFLSISFQAKFSVVMWSLALSSLIVMNIVGVLLTRSKQKNLTT